MNMPDSNPTAGEARAITMRVIGIGGAGGNAVDHMARQDFPGVTFAVVNTDAQALGKCGVTEKMVLGGKSTRGLGTGGDPELGRSAAREELEKIKLLCGGADIVFIVTGLGGGTGTGASPVVAEAAKEAGALVLAMATMPFDFEGQRRLRQAQSGLQQLKAAADAVICLPNQRIFKLIDENTSVLETFAISNELLAQGLRGVWRMLTQAGLINVDFNDLCSVTRGRHSESSFATAEVSGENRSQQIVEKLLSHPLLEGGQTLQEADTILVSLAGGPDLTMSEVNRVMEQINRQAEGAHLIFGAAIEESYRNRLTVTLVATRRTEREENRLTSGASPKTDRLKEEEDTRFLSASDTSRPASRFVPPPPEWSEEKKGELLTRQNGTRSRKKIPSGRQGQLPLEIISKGRFEKSEPTIHQGEDLDIPTYVRRGVALN